MGIEDTQRAFAYVLNATAPALRDLGDLGTADYAQAVDVDAGVVVGNSFTHRFRHDENGRHPFAYDLRAASPRMRDLGDLGYDRSFATAVGQGTVVGQSWTARHSVQHAFLYDLRATSPRMRDIGTLGGSAIQPLDVNDGVVVGVGNRAADGIPRAFAYDARAPRPALTDLGTLGGRKAAAAAVDGRIVVGTSDNADGAARATLWTLRYTTAPALRFSSHRYSATETPHRVRITVVRAGRTTPAVSVRYRASRATATAGKDFRGTGGVLRFAAGETRKSFYVSVLGDSARESAESVLLTLTPQGTGTILGTPRTAGLIIAASDQRADALISTNALSGFIGNNIIGNGTRQTRTLTAHRTTIRTFHVQVQNDGNATNTYALRGTGVGPGARVRYFLGGSIDVTQAMRSKAGRRIIMDQGSFTDLTARVTVLRRADVGSSHTAAVSATWRGDVTRTDVVRGVVKVVR
jgi:probable HAF family extracellular repeat protein